MFKGKQFGKDPASVLAGSFLALGDYLPFPSQMFCSDIVSEWDGIKTRQSYRASFTAACQPQITILGATSAIGELQPKQRYIGPFLLELDFAAAPYRSIFAVRLTKINPV